MNGEKPVAMSGTFCGKRSISLQTQHQTYRKIEDRSRLPILKGELGEARAMSDVEGSQSEASR